MSIDDVIYDRDLQRNMRRVAWLRRQKDPRWAKLWDRISGRVHEVSEQAKGFLAQYEVDDVEIREGYVHGITLKAAAFFRHKNELDIRIPRLRHLELTDLAQSDVGLLYDPVFLPLRALRLNSEEWDDNSIEMISNNPYFANVCWLWLSAETLSNAGLRSIAKSRYLDNLCYLNLSGMPVEELRAMTYELEQISPSGYLPWLHAEELFDHHPPSASDTEVLSVQILTLKGQDMWGLND